jgi:uncharacterized protein (DUF2126 family)
MEGFELAVREHDQQLARAGTVIWVGSEPTFTDRWSERPEWLYQALGGDKEARAGALAAALSRRFPGGALLRTLGRQYPGEDLPRWSLGLYRRRDGMPVWDGPPDPLLLDSAPAAPASLGAFRDAICAEVKDDGWRCAAITARNAAEEERLLLHRDAQAALPTDALRLLRPSLHATAIPAEGLHDTLADEGWHLLVLRVVPVGMARTAVLELPAFHTVTDLLAVLGAVARAAQSANLAALALSGFPPPVDQTIEWTTVTPDPAVIEINSAPDGSALAFLERARVTHAVAREQGLSPYRLYYTGTVADSGGGGQITLGGPTPEDSPFLREPALLPRLVRFLNRHPALSYLYAHDYAGPSGQSVRADERGPYMLDELGLTLRLLETAGTPSPELLWRSLAPFLADAAGNSHRAEINIEKLWNPYLSGRGQLGLVELRSFRMQHEPERAAALVCLLRAILAMLARQDCAGPLVDWGRVLHDRFALPFHLRQDLLAVLDALAQAGLGLAEPIRQRLLDDDFRLLGELELPGCRLRLSRAVECWPLVGDASTAQGASRLVDASTARIELLLRPNPASNLPFEAWELSIEGWRVPLRAERDEVGPLKVLGLRYRSFAPFVGLHPTLGAQSPLTLTLVHPAGDEAYAVSLHDWRRDGTPYPGLPQDLDEAARRRRERLVTARIARASVPPPLAPRAECLTPWCLDLRHPALNVTPTRVSGADA